MESITAGGRIYGVKVEYRDGKTSTAEVRGDCIVLNISTRIPQEGRDDVFGKLKERIIKRLENPTRARRRLRRKMLKTYNNGDIIEAYGVKLRIHIDYKNAQGSAAKLAGDDIYLSISSRLSQREEKKHIQELVRLAVSQHRLPKLEELVSELNKQHFNVPFRRVMFRKQTTRWGSCSIDGNINISYRLLYAPLDVLEYVCIHELAHLIEPNHSRRFWALVREAMPDHKEKEKWLKKHGDRL